MVALETRVIEELDSVTFYRSDLIILEPLKASPIFEDSITLMSNIDFSLDNPKILTIMQNLNSSSKPNYG